MPEKYNLPPVCPLQEFQDMEGVDRPFICVCAREREGGSEDYECTAQG